MEPDIVGLIGHVAENSLLPLAGIRQQRQRLIAVAGEDHLVKPLLAVTALDHHAIRVPPYALHRTGEADLRLPTRGKGADIFPRATRDHIPLGAIGHIEQAVVGKKAQEEAKGEGAHIGQGR